jgi:hypothetical protein
VIAGAQICMITHTRGSAAAALSETSSSFH